MKALLFFPMLYCACSSPVQEKIPVRVSDTLHPEKMDASKLPGYYEYMNEGGKWGYEMELNRNGKINFSFVADTTWDDYKGTWKIRHDTLFASYDKLMRTLSSHNDWGYGEDPVEKENAVDTIILYKGKLTLVNKPLAEAFTLTDDSVTSWNGREGGYYWCQADQLLKEMNALVKNGDPVHGISKTPDPDSAFRFISKRNDLDNLRIMYQWEKGKYVLSPYDPQKFLQKLNWLVRAAGDGDHCPEGMASTGESIVMFEAVLETLQAYGIRVRWSESRNRYVLK
jgi:hypothetical protein